MQVGVGFVAPQQEGPKLEQVWLPVAAGYILAIVAPLLARSLPRVAPWLFALYAGLSFLGFLSLAPRILAGDAVVVGLAWLPALDVGLWLRVDGFGLLFALLVTGIGTLIFVYAAGYLAGSSKAPRLYGVLLAFAASMLGLVLADDLVLLFIFWELTGLTSYLLIGIDNSDAGRRAANQAFIITTTGGLALLAGILLIWHAAGTTRISELLADPAAVRSYAHFPAIILLVVIGSFVKSAQVPLHFWLPGAMTAPTPVSAYLHSATMVKAGVYLLARLTPVLGANPLWSTLLVSFGALTMVLAAWFAVRGRDFKQVLAYSTVSALGMLVLLIGIGTPIAMEALIVVLLAHALYKAALFMVAGAVDHSTGTRDITELRGLWRKMPITAAAAIVAAASLAGLIPLFSFIGKELFFDALLGAPVGRPLLLVTGTLTAMMLVAVALVVSIRPFFGPLASTPVAPHDGPWPMLAAPLVLGSLGLFLGFFPRIVGETLVPAAAQSVLGVPVAVKLELWHGITPALLMSGVSLIGGVLLFAFWTHMHRLLGKPKPRGAGFYARTYGGLQTFAKLFTRRVQVGQLTVYLAVVASAAIFAGALPMVLTRTWPALTTDLSLTFYELAIGVVLIAGALFVAKARAPLAAVVALGLVGYAVALVFILFGAPDLAMTQFMFETLAALLFLLVVPRLPAFRKVAPGGPSGRAMRLIVPLFFGLMMGGLTLFATQMTHDASFARFYSEASLPEAHGRNIVNVILVDFRALDTLGEVIVLVVAGLGIAALLHRKKTPLPGPARDLKSPPADAPERPVALRTLTVFLVALLVLYSVFILLRGHNLPGGGFVGGLIAGAAVGLYTLSHNADETHRLLRVAPVSFIVFGLAAALVSGLIGLFFGEEFLTAIWPAITIPVLAGIKPGTPLLFDIGVYAIVLGVTALALVRLGEEKD